MNQSLSEVISIKPRHTSRCTGRMTLGLVAVLVLGITGCSGAPPTPALGMVKGKISINGAPAPNIVVTLESQTAGVGRSGGVTNALGEFELSYLGTSPNPKGAPVGKHIVRITSASTGTSNVPSVSGSAISAGGFGDPADDAPKTDVVVIPETYNASSNLYTTVAAGENPPLNYDLKIPKK